VLELVRPVPDGRVARPSAADGNDADCRDGNGVEPGAERSCPEGVDGDHATVPGCIGCDIPGWPGCGCDAAGRDIGIPCDRGCDDPYGAPC
jgi:hypothetical protein